MTLSAGSRLGPYEILSPLGAGGMGEVYRARDTRLDRTVAIKVLSSHLSASPESRQRFEREAKTISQLSHPHICALHDVGREGDVEYLVMEYLEGETLADRLLKGALPLEQTLRFGMQIADALDKAHRQGIVHRDLKPGNVMLTKSGVKLLDFGLAKAMDAKTQQSSLTALPTQLTQEGTILGTFQYMAPEQLEGKEADARTDIFAFGCVLYEMATGKKAFSGATQASLISSILRDEPPPLSQVQPTSPSALDHVIRKSLAKDPEDRWQNAADLGGELKWIAEGGSQTGIAAPVSAPRRRDRERVAWSVAAVLFLSSLALAWRAFSRPAPAAAVLRASILPPDGAEFVSAWLDAGPVEVSPDGTKLVFAVRRGEGPNQLWVRALNEAAARPLSGTDGAQRPFWSPDGRFIGFFADRALKKIGVDGGPAFTLARPAMEPRGGTWNRDGVILFTPDARGPIYRVRADGGKVEPATVYAPGDATHRYSHFLPDGKHFLYLVRHSGTGAGRLPSIRVGSLDSKESKEILSVGSNVIYASGHLLYVREGALVAQPFDPDKLVMRGDPIPVVPNVLMDERFSRGVFSASENGVLAFQTGSVARESVLRWLDRSGKTLGTVGEPAHFFNGGAPNISPDGTRAMTAIVDVRTGIGDLWMIDLARGTRSRFTTGPGDKFTAIWSPDGRRISYNVEHSGEAGYDIVLRPTAEPGQVETLVSGPVENEFPCGFSPDGQSILYQDRRAGSDDLYVLPLTGERKPRPLAASPTAFEQFGQFSPDGRYVAYASDESGRTEIYVVPLDGHGGPWQVSANGGTEPRWRGDGKELFFFGPDNRLMAAKLSGDADSFEVGAIEPLFQLRSSGFNTRYDVAKDGTRFLVIAELPHEFSPITLVTNWTAELGKK